MKNLRVVPFPTDLTFGIFDLDNLKYLQYIGTFKEMQQQINCIIADEEEEARKKESPCMYELWNTGKLYNVGSFHTSLFKTYQLADAENSLAIKLAFPDLFY